MRGIKDGGVRWWWRGLFHISLALGVGVGVMSFRRESVWWVPVSLFRESGHSLGSSCTSGALLSGSLSLIKGNVK